MVDVLIIINIINTKVWYFMLIVFRLFSYTPSSLSKLMDVSVF